MQADAHIGGSKHARIIVGGQPHKPDGNAGEIHTDDTFFIPLAQRTSTSDDYKEGDVTTVPVAEGVEERVERLVWCPTGAGDEKGKCGQVGRCGTEFGSEGLSCTED